MNISFLREKGSKYLIYILLGVLVLVLCIPSGSSTQVYTGENEMVENDEMELRLKNVLSSMEGVGKVEVMVSMETEQESVFGTSGQSQKVCGVVVVAEGAGNATVDARITEAVKALFSVDSHKISIVKMKSQEGDK